MKKHTKSFLVITSALLATSFLCVGVACAQKADDGEPYEFTFDKPQAGTPDDFMTIDGKFDEEVWKDKSVLSQTLKEKGVSWSATTHFTDKGIYIGVRATDDTMTYETRYTSRSEFDVYLCKSGTQTYDINGLDYHQGRTFVFQLDPYYCRSKSRVPYYYKAHVEGELNSETECTMTAELFLTWKDLYYTQEELGEKGYPDDVQMYVNYEGESSQVLGTCSWREETYLHFDKDGYMAAPEDPDLGSVRGGLSATDGWEVNGDGNLYTTAGRTQILWLKDAYAKDFAFEAKLRPIGSRADGSPIKLRGETVSGRIGLITENANADYSVYSADARSAAAGTVDLQTCREIDSFHWQNQIGLSQKSVGATNDDFITLRIIKQDDMLYYFCGDKFWDSERIPTLQDSVYCGIFTSQGVEVLDYNFRNFGNRTDALKEALSEYMYFIETSGASTYGRVTTSRYAVPKGEEVTVSFHPASRGVLTRVSLNGEDAYEQIVAAMNKKCEYTFTPEGDTAIDATFSSFAQDALVQTVVKYVDGSGEQIRSGNYEIAGSNKLLFYRGTTNSSGYVILQLPKAGEYTVDGRTFTVSGEYELYTSFAEYHAVRDTFTLNEQTTSTDINGKEESVAKDKKFTKIVAAQDNDWGQVTVNGVTVSGSGTLLYNEDTGNYYTDGNVSCWFKTMVGDDFILDVKLDVTNIGHSNNDLAGIQITNGRYIVVFKANLEVGDGLFIATGSGTETTEQEICLNGFGWKDVQNPTTQILGAGSVAFRLVKSGSVLYIYNADGAMRAYLNANGVQLVNGTTVAEWSRGNLPAVNADLAKLFGGDTAVAVGARTYRWKSITVEFGFTYEEGLTDEVKEEISYGAAKFDKDIPFDESLYKLKEGYAKGETVKFAVSAPGEAVKAQLIVETSEGVQIIEGIYDYSMRSFVFRFITEGGDFKAKISLLKEGSMEWSEEWNAFEPDRGNTNP